MANKKPESCSAQEKQLQDANLKKSWYEQAYLISYLHEVSEPLRLNRNPSKFVKLIETKDNSDALVNNLTVSPDIMTFLDAFPIDYSQLVPHIELYKVYIKNKKRETIAEELFPFEAHTNFTRDWTPEKMLTPFRGSDAGIQSINVKMEGQGRNPVQANILDITIKFHFNDVKVLFKKWISKSGFGVSYSDLIRFPPSLMKADPRAKFASFRIKLVLGWNVNKNNPILKSNNREDFINAAENSKINIVADLYAHTMEFKENGSLTLTAKYKGAIEQAFSTPSADLLNSFNVDGEDLRTLKAQLTNLEMSFWEDAAKSGKKTGSGGDATNRAKQIESLLEMKRKIKKIKELTEKIKNDPKNQTYIAQQKTLTKDYKKLEAGINTTAGEGKSTSELMNAAKNTPSDQNKMSNYAKSKDEQIIKKLKEIAPGRGKEKRKAYKKALEKATKTLRNSIQALESNMRAQNLFIFVQEMMRNNKVAWISTESNSAFTSYVEYRGLIDEGALQGELAEKKAEIIANQTKNPAKKPTKSINESAKGKLGQAMHPEATDTTVTLPSGQKINISTHKKLGTSSKLYLSDAYTKGHKLFFFTLGDLISTILDSNNFGDGIEQLSPGYRILFGTMDYQPAHSDQIYSSNLYDLPISLNMFTNFLAKKIAGTGRKAYPFLSFIHDLVKFVMNKIVAGTGARAKGAAMVAPRKSRSFKLDMTPIDLHHSIMKSDIQKGRHVNAVIDVRKVKEKYAFGRKMAANKISNTLLLHVQNDDPFRARIKKTQTADFFLDRAQGIQHFIVGGPNRGVLKTIKFTEHNNALFNVAMYRNAQAGGISSGQGVIKPSKFNCDVTLVGNPYFFIGQLFYVDTQLISDKNFLRENIMNGGYYMVISVDNNFSAAKWETSIKGILTIADSVIYKGEKANSVKLVSQLSPEEKALLQDVYHDRKSEAVNNVKQPPLTTK